MSKLEREAQEAAGMNELQVFSNPQFGEIRTVELEGEPWFVGKDVAKVLGYQNPQRAIRDHVDEEDKGVTEMVTPGGKQTVPLINESGVYSLIFSSKLEKAKEFKRWVTAEVLPTIRKQGGYLTPTVEEAIRDLIERVEALEQRRRATALPAPPEGDGEGMGPMSKRQWMRTFNWKLELLAERFGRSTRKLLHELYSILEEKTKLSLEEERQRVMEEREMEECSILTAIFYTPRLREELQYGMDRNLSPKHRGW